MVKLAAEKAGWGQALPDNTGLGLATSFGQERNMPTWVFHGEKDRVVPIEQGERLASTSSMHGNPS